MAYKLCETFHKKYEKLILYFMTDGVAKYPAAAIDEFNNKNSFKKKIEFSVVGFGEDIEIECLKEMG